MLFNSFEFLIFFCIVIPLYFALPLRGRQWLLLIASAYFYMRWNPAYILLLLFTTGIDFYIGHRIAAHTDTRKRKAWLLVSLISNLGMLFVFKYFNFFTDTFNLPVHVQLLLPVGISFYTFHAISYVMDVYRGRQAPERNFFIFLVYIIFFPQLVAGPISRATAMLHQFHAYHAFNASRVADGFRLILWGFFKKVVIADKLALVADTVYHSPQDYTGWPLIVGTLAFCFQIFCDFSGYTDIALGLARMMGYELPLNFYRPYFAGSFQEFWQRWHISLSTWFRDYLYIPLGGNRVPLPRVLLNLMIVFMVSGLWHGAAWTFVAWGALHGIYIVANVLTGPYTQRLGARLANTRLGWLWQLACIGLVFFLTNVAWVFFRAQNFTDAWHVLTHAFVFEGTGNTLPALGPLYYPICLGLVLLLEGVHAMQALPVGHPLNLYHSPLWRDTSWLLKLPKQIKLLLPTPRWLLTRGVAYAALLFATYWLGVFTNHEFIYFVF